MPAGFQRALARAVAFVALLLGAALAVVLAIFTLVSGLLIGLVATVAAWLGAGSRRRRSDSRFGDPGTASSAPPERRPDDLVIDVEMREIEPGSTGPAETPAGNDQRPDS